MYRNISTMKEGFSLEDKLREIRSLLDQMQSGELDFDENVKLFTQGSQLIEQCRKYLDEAELQVKQLVEGKEGEEEEDFS